VKPKIGITLGDPAGIGYEVTAKALIKKDKYNANIFLIGNKEHFKKVLSILKISEAILNDIVFYDIDGGPIEFGKVQREAGRISLESVKVAVELALNDKLDAIVTAPINKEAWILAGSQYIDHTTLLQALTNSRDSITIFEVKRLRIYFLTRHIPLRKIFDEINKENIVRGIIKAHKSLKLLGVDNGKIAVAALNPHAGEDGLLGREEIDIIKPAIDEARTKFGINVSGPFSADSVFYQAAKGAYDIVISLYHDQGHIAAKMYDFRRTVSLTIGLPFLRTSVDHGTAFDIAGKGLADETSMVEAIKKAIKYALNYKRRIKELKIDY
jgi:4-hydroxythreonine-4-phosphate dehydrogenase